MKKLLLALAVLTITWIFTGVSLQAQAFQIGQTSEAPTIDGTVDDLWNTVASYVAVDPTTWTPKADLISLEDCSFKWSGLWDATNLYLLVQIMDDTTTIGSQAEGSAAIQWMNDNIEMVLNDPAAAKQPYKYRFAFDRDNDTLVAINAPKGYVFETSAVEGGWVLEVSIPWSILTNDSIDFSAYPAVDKILNMNLVAADLDNVNGSSWDQLSGHIQWPKGWSATDVTLVAEAAVDATAPAAPANVKATDITFGGATISWDAPADEDITGMLVLKNGAPFSYVPESTTSINVNLSPEIEYTFTVIAVDPQNLSAVSNEAKFTTLGKPALKDVEISKYTGTESNPFNDLDAWAAQPMLDISYSGSTVEGNVLSGFFRAMWDEDNLYTVTYVVDNDIYNADPVNGWSNDNVEYHFDMGNERDGTSCEDVDGAKYFQDNFQYRAVPSKGEMQTGSTPAPDWTDITQATWEYYGEEGGTTAIGYYIEMKFPWATLNTTSGLSFVPANDAAFGFDLKIQDIDAGPVSAGGLVWSSYDRSDLNRNNSEYGQLVLKTIATSIDKDFAGTFSVFPNPASDILNIRLTEAGRHNISISDMSGRLVLSTQFDNPGSHVMNVRELSSGLYLLKVENGNKTGQVKILVK